MSLWWLLYDWRLTAIDNQGRDIREWVSRLDAFHKPGSPSLPKASSRRLTTQSMLLLLGSRGRIWHHATTKVLDKWRTTEEIRLCCTKSALENFGLAGLGRSGSLSMQEHMAHFSRYSNWMERRFLIWEAMILAVLITVRDAVFRFFLSIRHFPELGFS